MSDSDLHQRVLAAFQTEFQEQMEVLRALLAEWPGFTPVLLEDAFRMAHSMKGSARVCDLGAVEGIAHQMENILSDLTKGSARPTPELRAQLEAHANAAEDAMAEGLAEALAPAAAPVVSVSATESATAPAPAASNASTAHDSLRIRSSLLDELLQSSGLLLAEATRQEEVGRQLDVLTGELERLRRLVHQDRFEPGDLRFHVREVGKNLQTIRERQQRGSRQMRVLSGQLQEHVGRICMVPVGSVFEGFPKMMRDLAAEMGKTVHFSMSGTDSLADRGVLQALKEPVMHALRNALSHGIEPPAQRRAVQKPETGEVRLHLHVDGRFLNLTLQDDGRGVDVARVRQKAAQAGIITTAEAAQLSNEAAVDLIFHSGLSTAQQVTNVSGRGMGLSVVRERVAAFQGTTRMVSQPGQGSTLEIRVPVSISAHRLLLLRAAGQVFALPLGTLKAVLRVDEVQVVDGRSIILWEGASVPVTTAAEAAGQAPRITRGEDGQIQIALLQGQRPLALHVEAFLGEIHALVRPLPFPAALSPHFSGGIVTDEGTVVLVLNPQTLADRCRTTPLAEDAAPSAPAQAAQRATILVVDDSFTARTLQKSILETAGYHVRTAEDGRAALTVLHSGEVALVVSDVQMPHVNGFELLATMKSQPALAKIPLILVTSLSSQEDQERGLALGADAYIVKERFDHQELLGVVRQLVE
ncbi:MAG: hybrid sensor histidine kinase/response regulator [Prosthecobacter sp.]